jgi:aerobic-type carbon monoxide dehydrogenase small subunit (CoxS/CutS family)
MTDIAIDVDGQQLTVLDGQLLTSILVGAGIWTFRRHLVSGEPRGPFCGMGHCYECELTVDGERGVRACLVRARDGMTVRRGV